MPEVFRYHVERRDPGDYTEAAGPWRTVYYGSNHDEALDDARREATAGGQVRITVEVRRG